MLISLCFLIAIFAAVKPAAIPLSTVKVDCTQPRLRSTNCTDEEMVRMFHFSSIQNRCRGYLTCPLDDIETSDNQTNLFTTRPDCNQSCPATVCPLPTPPTNGAYQLININHQTKLNYFCQEGYLLKNASAERVCQYDGSWSGVQPYCERKQCPMPPVPVNGNYTLKNINNLTVLQYFCSSGYTLIGPSERSCTLNGTWIGEEPQCIDSTKVTCPEPPHIPKTLRHKACRDSQKPGCFVMYTCEKNYGLVIGNSWRICTSNGQWSGGSPVCGRVVITYGDKEVNREVKTNKGDKNVQIKCKMDPTFPSQAQAEWSGDSNATWIENKTAYALQFDVVTSKDDGDYTCTITISDGAYNSNMKRRISVRVLSKETAPPEATYPPFLFTQVTSDKIKLRGFFKGIPKPYLNWYKRGELMSNGSRVKITDLLHSNDKFTFGQIEITNLISSDFDTYRVEAINDVGVIAYDIAVIAPPSLSGLAKRKRRHVPSNLDASKVREETDLTSLCTTQNTVVFVGEYHSDIYQQTIHILIKRLIPAPQKTNYNILTTNQIIKVDIPPNLLIQNNHRPLNGDRHLFIAHRQNISNNKNGIVEFRYTLDNIYPDNLEEGFINFCSSFS